MKRVFIYLVLLNWPVFGDSLRTDVDRHEIQGGERIPSGSFQNVVYVNMDSGFCTGTLVHWNWILTAGHCVSINNGAQINPVNRVTFGRGESYRVDLFNIGRILIHPQYNSRGIPGFSYDYALVEILDGAPPGIEPVPLMSFDQERDFFTRSEREGIIIGHGYIRGGSLDLHLNYGKVPVQTSQECTQQQGVDPRIVHTQTICANSDNQFVGGGDSGSPLLVPTSLPDSLFGNELAEYSQLGVGSTRAKDRNDEDRVSVYGRASLVYDWVRETTLTPRILPHVFTGDLGGQDTWTEIIFTNTTSEPCPVTLIFSQGTEDAPPVQFNQAVYNRNRMVLTIPSGSTRMVEITSLGKSFVHGSLYINQDCHTTSLNIQGRYLVQDPQGTIQEVYSISPEDRLSWLGMDHCKILMSRFGNGRDVGLAFVTARPGQMAPSGSQLTFRAYTWDGNEAETLAPIPVTGKKDARNPWELNQPRMVEICLDTVERDSDFQLAIITVGAKATRGRVQYFTEDLIEP